MKVRRTPDGSHASESMDEFELKSLGNKALTVRVSSLPASPTTMCACAAHGTSPGGAAQREQQIEAQQLDNDSRPPPRTVLHASDVGSTAKLSTGLERSYAAQRAGNVYEVSTGKCWQTHGAHLESPQDMNQQIGCHGTKASSRGTL